MMDHLNEQSKPEPNDERPEDNEKPRSYYYDDATNYETYRDDDEDDDDESPPSQVTRD